MKNDPIVIENEKDYQLIYTALIMRANHIETDDPTMSERTAYDLGYLDKIKKLSIDQIKLCIRIRDLAQVVLHKKLTL